MSFLSSDDRGLIIPCPSCGTKNRLAFDRLGHATRCAKCHADIALPATPQEVDSDLASRLGIQGIPTLAVFAHGREAARTSGAMPADQIEAFVREAVVTT